MSETTTLEGILTKREIKILAAYYFDFLSRRDLRREFKIKDNNELTNGMYRALKKLKKAGLPVPVRLRTRISTRTYASYDLNDLIKTNGGYAFAKDL